jgi:hypothetical protein
MKDKSMVPPEGFAIMGLMKDKPMVPPEGFVHHGAYERQIYGSSSEICPSYSWVDRRLKKRIR